MVSLFSLVWYTIAWRCGSGLVSMYARIYAPISFTRLTESLHGHVRNLLRSTGQDAFNDRTEVARDDLACPFLKQAMVMVPYQLHSDAVELVSALAYIHAGRHVRVGEILESVLPSTPLLACTGLCGCKLERGIALAHLLPVLLARTKCKGATRNPRIALFTFRPESQGGLLL